jgi:hypothetical protein
VVGRLPHIHFVVLLILAQVAGVEWHALAEDPKNAEERKVEACKTALVVTPATSGASKNLIADFFELFGQLRIASSFIASPFSLLEFKDKVEVYNSLSFTADKNGAQKPNLLHRARELNRQLTTKPSDVTAFLRKLTAAAQKLLKNIEVNPNNNYRERILELYYAAHIIQTKIALAMPPQESEDTDGKSDESKSPDKQASQKKKIPKPPAKKGPPEFFPKKLPKVYSVNKDRPGKGQEGETPERFEYAFSNRRFHYFRQTVFNIVKLGDENFFPSPLMSEPPGLVTDQRPSDAYTQYFTMGHPPSEPIELNFPDGYVPVVGNNTVAITRGADGSYTANLRGAADRVKIFMARPLPLHLSPVDIDILTSPVGIPSDRWPKKLQLSLLRSEPPATADGKLDVHATAKMVEKHLQKHYLYSKKAEERDPADALNAGRFKCDMAALIMTAIMRDHFKAPCRPVAGYRAQRRAGDRSEHSVFVVPSDGHAWVECYAEGEWESYDPTPVRKAPDEDPEPTDPESRFQPQAGDESEAPDENETDGTDAQDNDRQQQTSQAGEEKVSKEPPAPGTPLPSTDDITQGDITLDPRELSKQKLNKALFETIKALFAEGLSPQHDQARTLDTLLALVGAKLEQGMGSLSSWVSEATTQLNRNLGPTSETLRVLAAKLEKSPLPDLYRDFYATYFRLKFFNAMKSPLNGFTDRQAEAMVSTAISAIEDADREFKKLEGQNAKAVSLALSFLKGLPTITRSVLMKDMGISTLGNNAAVAALGQELLEGKHLDKSLIGRLYPMSNFITPPIESESYREIKTWTYKDKRGKDPDVVTDAADLFDGYATDPRYGIEESFRRGELMINRHRVRGRIPSNKGLKEPKRVTIICYDTSGSMGGNPGFFQASLIGAFADRALSDRGPGGNYLHQLVALGFDEKVHTTTTITNRSQAEEIIREHQSTLKNTSGGTVIMSCLEEAFLQIERAQAGSDNPLANANIILMSDGDDTAVDVDRLQRLRDRIDRKTKVQLGFVAINKTNPNLEEFVTSDANRKIGIGPIPYYRFDSQKIAHVISQAKRDLKKRRPNILVIDEDQPVPDVQNLRRSLNQAAAIAERLENHQRMRQLADPRQVESRLPRNLRMGSMIRTSSALEMNAVRGFLFQQGSVIRRVPNHSIVLRNLIDQYLDIMTLGSASTFMVEQDVQEFRHMMRDVDGFLSR